MLNNDDKKLCFGISSLCSDGQHVLFFDYDIKNLSVVASELEYIQKLFNLSYVYIISTDNGFNAICLDKLPFKAVLNVYSSCEIICRDFVKYCTSRHFFTLRMSIEKYIIATLTSNTNLFQKSLAHKIFFNAIMNFGITDKIGFDDSKVFTINSFLSRKHGFIIKELNNDGSTW